MLHQRLAPASLRLPAPLLLALLLLAAVLCLPSTGFSGQPAGQLPGAPLLRSTMTSRSPTVTAAAARRMAALRASGPRAAAPVVAAARSVEDDQWSDGFDLPPVGQGIEGGEYVHLNALLSFQGELIAAGEFTHAGGVETNNIACWNGTSWRSLASGLPGVVLALAEYHGELIVGGDFGSLGYLARWDGTSWSSFLGGANDQVWSLAVWGDSLVAGGRFTSIGGLPAIHVALWNGASWGALGPGLDNPGDRTIVCALTIFEGDLIAGGLMSASGGTPVGRVARWTGSAWSPLGSPGAWDALGSVGDFAVYDGVLHICGDFLYDAPNGPSYVARYDQGVWAPLGSGVDFWGMTMTVYHGALILGGGFASAGGDSASAIARWDGSTWSRLGSGVDDFVLALAVREDSLFCGGYFLTAGQKPSYRMARWGEMDPAAAGDAPVSLGPAGLELMGPNPFSHSLRLAYVLAQPGPVRLTVFAASGRRVAVLADQGQSAGRRWIDWNGRDAAGRPLPAGAYSLELRGGRTIGRAKAILIR